MSNHKRPASAGKAVAAGIAVQLLIAAVNWGFVAAESGSRVYWIAAIGWTVSPVGTALAWFGGVASVRLGRRREARRLGLDLGTIGGR